ncbi:hypothetical protein M0R45_009608 [Rubus argutus]|uniref:U-box domain-containing protein n=1 Tax=Rubus argutus TaxID=59490 RepID=A0AAW1Y728_RUBAR
MVRRDELHITVPNLFRCPISMDVMRSPVSLSTGVTYERSSIQHWLDSGHDTCPATMQILQSKDFVPNLNLRRLINLWAQSHGPMSPASSPILSDQQLRGLVQYIANENEKFNQNLFNSLAKMVDFAKASDENRRFLANFNGFVSAVVGVLNRQGVEIEVLELVMRLLDLISPQKRRRRTATPIDHEKQPELPLFDSISLGERAGPRLAGSPNAWAAVAERLMKGSKEATEDGVAVLWSVCCMLGDKRAQECVRKRNGVAKILLVMQSGYCEGHFVRRMCGDLMKVLSVGLGMGLSYDTMTKHIMPC